MLELQFLLCQNKIIEIKDDEGQREINCLRCKIPMVYSGNYKFHEGSRMGVLGSIFELLINRESMDLWQGFTFRVFSNACDFRLTKQTKRNT